MARILIVDDDHEFVTLYQNLLAKENITVEGATDGTTAFTNITDGGYDLILLDILMPDLNGIALLKKIHNFPPHKPNGPVVMLTALDDEDFAEACLKLGAIGFINKSMANPPEFIEQIKAFLSASPTTHPT